MIRRFLVLALAACAVPTAPTDAVPMVRNAVTDQAAALALACGQAHRLPLARSYASLRLYVADGLSDADYGQGDRGYVLTALREEPRVWAHLFLHLMYGLPGYGMAVNHPVTFAKCDLWPI